MNGLYRIVCIVLGGPVGMVVIPVCVIIFCAIFGIAVPSAGKLIGTGFVAGLLLGIFAPRVIEFLASLLPS